MKLISFDHVILVSDDIERTAAGFEQAGFQVTTRADRETGPSANRLVVFEDGSYLEILGFVDADYGAKHRLRPLLDAAGPAWGDWSLLVEDMPAWTSRMTEAGVAAAASPDYAKVLADGREWSLKLLQIGRGVGIAELPFLVSDNTAHNLRVPDTGTAHANGARRIVGLSILTDGDDRVPAALETMMPGTRASRDTPAGAVSAVRWTFGDHFVDLIEVGKDKSGLRDRLDRCGPSIHEVFIESPAKSGLLSTNLTAGCRTVLV